MDLVLSHFTPRFFGLCKAYLLHHFPRHVKEYGAAAMIPAFECGASPGRGTEEHQRVNIRCYGMALHASLPSHLLLEARTLTT